MAELMALKNPAVIATTTNRRLNSDEPWRRRRKSPARRLHARPHPAKRRCRTRSRLQQRRSEFYRQSPPAARRRGFSAPSDPLSDFRQCFAWPRFPSLRQIKRKPRLAAQPNTEKKAVDRYPRVFQRLYAWAVVMKQFPAWLLRCGAVREGPPLSRSGRGQDEDRTWRYP